METHNRDIRPLMEKIKSENKKAVLLLTDRGPDRSQESYANLYFYYKLWKEHDLDMIIVSSFAPGYSAYNPVEHLWSPLSRALTGVLGNPIADGDERPPAYLSLPPADKLQKEISVFDREMQKVKLHWDGKEFDGWPILTHVVESKECLDIGETEYNLVHEYCKLTSAFNLPAKFKEIHKTFKEIIKHTDRRSCEIMIKKCGSCEYCTENPIKSTALFNFIDTHTIFDPQPSHAIEGSFRTFLEMTEKEKKDLELPNTHFQNNNKKELG